MVRAFEPLASSVRETIRVIGRPAYGLAHGDWRGRGGCLLAPPNRHVRGRPYRWLVSLDQAPLAEVPAALRLLLDPEPPTAARPARTAGPDLAGHPYGRRVLADELATLGRAGPRPPQPLRLQGRPLRRRRRQPYDGAHREADA
jgi:Bifunctional DNA primase/polymerase, N-terminal